MAMTNNLALVVIGMAAVTYLPRMLPLVLLKDMRLPARVNAFLRFIPSAALSALIFPEVFHSTGSVSSAAAGTTLAVTLALFRCNIVVVVLGGIAGVVVWEMLMR